MWDRAISVEVAIFPVRIGGRYHQYVRLGMKGISPSILRMQSITFKQDRLWEKDSLIFSMLCGV